MTIAEVVAWWDRYGDKTKKTKINEIIQAVNALEGLATHNLDSAFHPDVNLMTEVQGDLLKYTGSIWDKLARGSNGQVLRAIATDIQWETPPWLETLLDDTSPALGGALDCNSEGLTEVAALAGVTACNFKYTHPAIPPCQAATATLKGHVTTGPQTLAGIKTFSSFPVTPSSPPTTNYQMANKKYVDDEILGATGVPSGFIGMWSGTIASIPSGWSLCDGGDTRPDLRAKFVRGARTGFDPGATGGSDSHNLTIAQMPAHSHTLNTMSNPGNHGWHYDSDKGVEDGGATAADNTDTMRGGHTHSLSLNNTGGGAAHENRPSYFEVAFIWKD